MHPRSDRRDFLRLATAGLAAPLLSLGQGGAQRPDDGDPTFTSNTRLVLLIASVTGKEGRPVPNIPQSAFTVLENGRPQPIRIFRREDVPVSLGLVVDNSGSMRDKRQKVEAATLAMVKSSQRSDEVFVANFNDELWMDSEFTSDLKQMEEALTKLDSRGGTAMRDAVSASIDYMKEAGKKPKKVILLVTDGDDNISGTPLERLVVKAQQSEILVYSIGILSEEERRAAKRAKRALDSLTSATGGLAYYPKELTEVERITQLVAQEIRNQYIIAYEPQEEALDGTYRRIEVKVRGNGNPLVRTRSGYYATKDRTPPSRSADVAPSALVGRPPADRR